MVYITIIFLLRCSSLAPGEDFPGQGRPRVHQNLPDTNPSRGPPRSARIPFFRNHLKPRSWVNDTQDRTNHTL